MTGGGMGKAGGRAFRTRKKVGGTSKRNEKL